MAQKAVTLFNLSKLNNQIKKHNVSTQTGDINEFFITLSKSKSLHMYYSRVYKEYVICLKFSNNKKYIITKDIWNILKDHFVRIDNIINGRHLSNNF